MSKAIQQWMRDVMSRRDWSAREWAVRADIPPTTITRFLSNDGSCYVPNGAALYRLAKAAGENPQWLKQEPTVRIPIYVMGNAKVQQQGTVAVTRELGDCIAYRLDDDCQPVAPATPGCIAIVKPGKATIGDIVVYTDAEGRLSAGVLQDKLVIGQTAHQALPLAATDILGTIVSIQISIKRPVSTA